MQEMESKNESKFYLNWRIFRNYFVFLKTSAILRWFSMAWSWISYQKLDFFLDFLTKLFAKILVRNPKNLRCRQGMRKIRDLFEKFKKINIIQDFGEKTKTSSTGLIYIEQTNKGLRLILLPVESMVMKTENFEDWFC